MALTLMQQAIKLVESGRDINEPEYGYDTTLLHVAADVNDNDVIKYLVGHGADINKPNRYGNTPFHYYVLRVPDIETVNYLLENGANADKRDEYGQTAAQRARRVENVDVAKYIESYYDMQMLTKGVHPG